MALRAEGWAVIHTLVLEFSKNDLILFVQILNNFLIQVIPQKK